MVPKLNPRGWMEKHSMVERVGQERVSGTRRPEDLKTHRRPCHLHQGRTLSGIWNWLVIKAAVLGVVKSQTRLSDFTLTFHFRALEKEMATHSSVLAWRIPGMEEPGGLPSRRSHRVRHNLSDLAAAAVIKAVPFQGVSLLQRTYWKWRPRPAAGSKQKTY